MMIRRKKFLPLLICIFWLMSACYSSFAEGLRREVREPTCTADGYIANTDEETGVIYIETLPALGHRYGEWIEDETEKSKTRICQLCGYSETYRISSIPEETLPKVMIHGDLTEITRKNRVPAEVSFQSMDDHFACTGILTYQGHSTIGLSKKNYTVRLYDDVEGTKKHKLQFANWRKEHKYILKANYADLTQSRNLACAALWKTMTSSRANLHPRIAALPTLGAVEGFPVALYLNDEFQGLYTWNLHKDDDLYGMKDDAREAILICNRQTSDEALFVGEAVFSPDYSSDWEVEYCGTEDESWAKDKFNQLIAFVRESTDEEFTKSLSELLDVDAAVDYLILIYTAGLSHSGAKDLVLLNYGDVWIPSAYDMDEAFGLDSQAEKYITPEEFLPQKTADGWISGTDSLLWDRLLNCFEERIVARYFALRESALREDEIWSHVQDVISRIPESYLDMDYYLYSNRPIDDARMDQQIREYIYERMPLLDEAMRGEAKR